MSARIVLEDGEEFNGKFIGIKKGVIAPLFFDTRVVGYQEVITEPANAGKILMLTYPLIGNYGINDKFNESKNAWIKGLIIKEKSKIYSNWQAEGCLDDFLTAQKLMAISEVDTRTLAVHLRDKGLLWAAISPDGEDKDGLLAKIRDYKKNMKPDYIKEISVKKITEIKGLKTGAKRIGILDLGVLRSLIRQLLDLCGQPVLIPYNTSSQDILKLKLKGLIISSGPEEDIGLLKVLENVRNIIGKIPILGISSGCEIIAQAFGSKIKKMKLGHHGVNYPVISGRSYKGIITVQNHSLVIDGDSLKKIKNLKVTAINLNDKTIEEIESPKLKIWGLQYYPASPGFNQPHPKLKEFIKLCPSERI